MAIRPAQQIFKRDEIAEILRRNVSLYKDEDGFVDYLVDLTRFLVENSQDYADGNNSSIFDAFGSPASEEHRPVHEREDPSPITPSGFDAVEDSEGEVGPINMPPKVSDLKNRQSGDQIKIPPKFNFPSINAPRPAAREPEQVKEAPRIPTPPPVHRPKSQTPPPVPHKEQESASSSQSNDSNPKMPKLQVYRKASPGSMTPEPGSGDRNQRMSGSSQQQEENRPKSSRIKQVKGYEPIDSEINFPSQRKGIISTNKKGSAKAHVYKVAKSYNTHSQLEVPCRECGTLMKQQEEHCPTCGAPNPRI